MTEVQVTQADAIEFLESACRNWDNLPPISRDDVADVAGALGQFLARHRLERSEPVGDAVIAAKAREALGTWLAWPDAPRDGPRPVTNEQVESWLHGLPNKLAGMTTTPPEPVAEIERKFRLGDRVTKTKGSSWTGLVVGFYSTSLTPIGYAVESENEPGSVQIYPESALAALGDAS